jgi:hypothetical protein
VSCCKLIVIKSDCKRSINKSNHPLQNPLLLVTEPRTRDSTLVIKIQFVKHNEAYEELILATSHNIIFWHPVAQVNDLIFRAVLNFCHAHRLLVYYIKVGLCKLHAVCVYMNHPY